MSDAAEQQSSSWVGVVVAAVVLGYLGLELSALHSQRYRAEPLFVHNEFVTADQATRRCGNPGAEERQRFQSNFEAVQRKALAALQEAEPQATSKALAAELDKRSQERISEVDAFIDANGCGHTDAWRWVKLHEVRARLNLR